MPHRNVPVAWPARAIGFATGFCYIVAIMYAINDYDALFEPLPHRRDLPPGHGARRRRQAS